MLHYYVQPSPSVMGLAMEVALDQVATSGLAAEKGSVQQGYFWVNSLSMLAKKIAATRFVLPLTGCQAVVKREAQQTLSLLPALYGSEGNACLYWLAIVGSHNLCISLISRHGDPPAFTRLEEMPPSISVISCFYPTPGSCRCRRHKRLLLAINHEYKHPVKLLSECVYSLRY